MQKNLNDIIPPSRRRVLEGASMETTSYETVREVPPQAPERPSYARPHSRPKANFPWVTGLIALLVVAISIGALFAFSGAEANIVATENQSSVSGEFIATASEGDLPFEVLVVEKTASASVKSEGTENVNQSAQGTITITNKQDVPQQLIKNTRFETPDGLIFRIRDSVVVPAAKAGAPGTLDTTVYADATGDRYNVGATTFTLPGLSGSQVFTLVTASSKEAMKGGFAGPRPSVSQATRDTQSAKLRTELEPEIQEALADAIPTGYVLVPGASRISYESQPDGAANGGNVDLSEKASATAVIFPSSALARAIGYQVVGSYSGQAATLKEVSGLTLAPVGDLPQVGASEFAFSLSGSTSILWQVDQAKIAGAVAGKSRSSAETLISGFPEVESATFVLRPFWKSSFPADPAKIKVTVQNAE